MTAITTEGINMPKDDKKVKDAAAKPPKVSAKSDVSEVKVKTEVALDSPTTEEEPAVTLAKAGKRSAKAIKEQTEKEAKEERKQETETEATKVVKKTLKPTRTKVERRGKKYRELIKMIDKTKLYSLNDAVELAVKTNPSKFDATVELHVRLRVDSRQADQNIRDTITLPSGTGKTVRIAVFSEATDDPELKKAGADIIGTESIIAKIDKNQIDFDVLVAQPLMMQRLGRYAKVLGPRGLMPSPKSGTVTNDLAKAVNELKLGRVEYRVDSNGIVHLGIGKVSFGVEKILANANAVMTSINGNRPNSIKGNFIRSAYMATSMGPSIQLEITSSAPTA
jgi:large subunit ribosomal protein L1